MRLARALMDSCPKCGIKIKTRNLPSHLHSRCPAIFTKGQRQPYKHKRNRRANVQKINPRTKAGYALYNQTQHWKETRRRKLESVNCVCELCRGVAVQAHHLHYKTLWHETNEDLQALCRDCHQLTHFGTPQDRQNSIDSESERLAADLDLTPVFE
jgi:hypothetical protein